MPATTPSKKAAQAASNKYGQKWKKEKFHDLDLPSENVCQVRRPGVQGLIKAGVLESMDVLTALVQQVTLPRAEGKKVVDQDKIMDDPETVKKMLDILDDICLYVVHRPTLIDKYYVFPDGHPSEGQRIYYNDAGEESADRNAGKPRVIPDSKRLQDDETDDSDPIIYVDEVDLDDKMFIMNYVVGGSRDLATFRDATQEALGGVHDVEADEPPTE